MGCGSSTSEETGNTGRRRRRNSQNSGSGEGSINDEISSSSGRRRAQEGEEEDETASQRRRREERMAQEQMDHLLAQMMMQEQYAQIRRQQRARELEAARVREGAQGEGERGAAQPPHQQEDGGLREEEINAVGLIGIVALKSMPTAFAPVHSIGPDGKIVSGDGSEVNSRRDSENYCGGGGSHPSSPLSPYSPGSSSQRSGTMPAVAATTARLSLSTSSMEGCVMCLEPFRNGKDEVRLLPCGHIFHSSCIDEWLKRKRLCPSCNQDVVLTGELMKRKASSRSNGKGGGAGAGGRELSGGGQEGEEEFADPATMPPAPSTTPRGDHQIGIIRSSNDHDIVDRPSSAPQREEEEENGNAPTASLPPEDAPHQDTPTGVYSGSKFWTVIPHGTKQQDTTTNPLSLHEEEHPDDDHTKIAEETEINNDNRNRGNSDDDGNNDVAPSSSLEVHAAAPPPRPLAESTA